jgi:hypothetical protein
MTPAPIAWSHAAAEIDHRCDVDAAMLARALRALGLVREFQVPRGAIAAWPPAYQRLTPWRARYMSCGSLHARGWRQREWQDMPAAEARMDAQDQRQRDIIADQNRRLRDAAVFVLSRVSIEERDARRGAQDAALGGHDSALAEWFATPASRRGARPVLAGDSAPPRDLVFLQIDGFAWRDRAGTAFGDGLASLADFVWQAGRGRAIARLARVVGVELLSVRDLDRRVQEAQARAAA